MSPKVSVLTPLYNTPEPILREMIESILNQSFKDFEFLLLNDSPDNERIDEIVRSYNDPRIIFLDNVKNLGISASRNVLLARARGEYVAIFDHDDISTPDRLEKEAAFLDANPHIGVVSSRLKMLESGKVTKWPTENMEIKRALLSECVVAHTASMIRRSVLDKWSIRWEEQYTPSEDYMLWVRLMGVTMFANIAEPLVLYREHPTSDSFRAKMMDAASLVRCIAQREFPYLKKRSRWVRLFGCIPFLWIRERGAFDTRVYLFGKIPLYYIKD